MADACNANPQVCVQFMYSQARTSAERASRDQHLLFQPFPSSVALNGMWESCDLEVLIKELCQSWSLFQSLAQQYLQDLSTNKVTYYE